MRSTQLRDAKVEFSYRVGWRNLENDHNSILNNAVEKQHALRLLFREISIYLWLAGHTFQASLPVAAKPYTGFYST